MNVAWFCSYDPGKGLRKYTGTINHIINDSNLPICGIKPAFHAERLRISGVVGQAEVDCKLCIKKIQTGDHCNWSI